MKSMRFDRFTVVLVLLGLALGTAAWAEPVAPLSPYKEEGMELIRMQNKTLKDVEKEIPSKATVGVPIYPRATFASALGGEGKKNVPPTVNLISDDPPEKVKAWYRENLPGWGYSEKFALFYDGKAEPTFEDLLTVKYQTVNVMEETGDGLDLMFLDVPDVKSRIQIIYRPKK